MSVILELSLFPLGAGESVSPYVARAVRIVRESGLPHELGPMGTCVEGEWDEVMMVAHDCFEALRADCDRVYMTMKVDYRKGTGGRLDSKTASVRSKL